MIADLIDARGRLVYEMQALLNQNLTPEIRHRFASIDRDQELLRQRIKALEKTRRSESADSESYQRAWSSYLRNGRLQSELQLGLTGEERSILEAGDRRDVGGAGNSAYPGATAGYFAPTPFAGSVFSAMKFSGPMLEACSFLDTSSGAPLPYPTDNDTGVSGEQVDEGSQVTTADVPLAQITFGAFKYSSRMIKVSVELMQDSFFDLEEFLAAKAGVRLARVLSPIFTNGSGIRQPLGLLSGIPIGVVAVGSSTTDGSTGTGGVSVGVDDLINLEHSLDFAYRRGSSYMLSDTTLRSIKELKTKSGAPLWQAGLTSGSCDTVNGYTYFINPAMPSIAPGAITIVFGRLDFYTVRRAGLRVQRLDERFADYGQVAFIVWLRADGRLLAGPGDRPVLSLMQAAS